MSQKRSAVSYLKWPLIVTFVGLVLSAWLGWETENPKRSFFIFASWNGFSSTGDCFSFDNAIVNANKLVEMTPIWRQRFLTWGILIAVFGMRIVFPVAIVATFAWINPFAAMHLALSDPDEYSHIIHQSHSSIAAFGGTFLIMVSLKFFIDEGKSVDWIVGLERNLRKWGSIRGFEIALVLLIISFMSQVVHESQQASFLLSAISGLLIFTLVDGLGSFLDDYSNSTANMGARGGLGHFCTWKFLTRVFHLMVSSELLH